MVLPGLQMRMSSPDQLNTLSPLPLRPHLWLPHFLSAYSPSVAPLCPEDEAQSPCLGIQGPRHPFGALLLHPACQTPSLWNSPGCAHMAPSLPGSIPASQSFPQMTPDPWSSAGSAPCSASAAWLLSVGFITRLPKSPLGWLKTACKSMNQQVNDQVQWTTRSSAHSWGQCQPQGELVKGSRLKAELEVQQAKHKLDSSPHLSLHP